MTPPQAISTPQPAYPADARTQGITATVVVKFVVTETGEVTNVTVVRGHPMFDAAVLAAVRTWRYKPALAAGRPVPVTKSVRIPFTIKM
jgi:protein TonB